LRHFASTTSATPTPRSWSPPAPTQAQLGHTSINVTLNTYGHLFPDAFADVGPALDRLVETARRETHGAEVGLNP
jgi:integrase